MQHSGIGTSLVAPAWCGEGWKVKKNKFKSGTNLPGNLNNFRNDHGIGTSLVDPSWCGEGWKGKKNQFESPTNLPAKHVRDEKK